jgi:predicted flap endonuclease-1-like 5' DNA nuclease
MRPQPDRTLTALFPHLVLSLVFQAQPGQSRFPLWLILLILVILVGLGWLWWSRRQQAVATKEASQPSLTEAEPPATVAPAVVTSAEKEVGEPLVSAEPVEPDDLTRIEGIGPKIAGLLQTAGITTFNHLAAADVGRLRAILDVAGLARLADPTSWPEQAQLAAAGQWAELETLQANLKGGRRGS